MVKQRIAEGKTFLGIELGSTRIKACLTDSEGYMPLAGGSFEWENHLEDGYWTYSLDEVDKGIKECYQSLKADVAEKYGVELCGTRAIGISGMMHGYLAFDADGNQLAQFRTWRNTTTKAAAEELSELFDFNIPQRWSIAHLYQAILNGEEHVGRVAHITTLSGYVHYLITGKWELGICEASGMFPVSDGDYNTEMAEKFNLLAEKHGLNTDILKLLPSIKKCGSKTPLTDEGARFIDVTGKLKPGIAVCPPEGDAGTGMVATNSVKVRTGNISVGTSAFSMVVLEKNLESMYPEIDMVTTPEGFPVAMVHSNNGCSELDVWARIFGEFAEKAGLKPDKSDLYNILYRSAEKGDEDCGGVMAYNLLAGEPVIGVKAGKPTYYRQQDGEISLANFFRAQIYAIIAPLRVGMDILWENEDISIEGINAHGGLFKVEGVAQQILADALELPVFVGSAAGEGGAWGMALLAAYADENNGEALDAWLENGAFAKMKKTEARPKKSGTEGFLKFLKGYKASLGAIASLK